MRVISLISSCLLSLSVLAGPHTLQRGESFEDVARLYGVNLDSLKKCNPDIVAFVGYTIDVPIENHFVDLGDSDLFRRLQRNDESQKEKGLKKYKSAFEKQTKLNKTSRDEQEKLQLKIQEEYEEAVEYGNMEALYQLGRRYVHGRFYPHDRIPDFQLDINPDIDEFSKGIEYMQIVGLLTGKPSAYIDMAVSCGHEDSPIRNPYLCISMLEVYADTKGWPVNELICHMYENGYGIKKNLMQAYIYCGDTELIGNNGSTSKRERLLREISELPRTKENAFYGNELDTKTMLALGISCSNEDKISPQGLYWLHKAALQNDAEANWTLASILKNSNYQAGVVGSSYDIDQQVMVFVEKASSAGHKEATEYLTAYQEYEAQKAKYERQVANQKRQEEEAKKARRRQMWANIASTILQTTAQTWGQIEYAKQVNQAHHYTNTSMPYIGNISENQWMTKNRLAMDQILQYTVNKTMADWNGTPMVPTDMSAVNLGTDMSPGSPLWSWGMQQQINRMSTQNARMQCETLAFYRRQTDMIEQQLIQNPFQPIAGYVNKNGNWISGENLQTSISEEGSSAIHHSSNNTASDRDRYGYKECHMCHGSGICQTCNGNTTILNSMTLGTSECPNCHIENMQRTGKCSTCQGRGTKYRLK